MNELKKWAISIMITVAMFLFLTVVVWLSTVMIETATIILKLCFVIGIITVSIKWTFFD